jgi:hypothetical protein
MNVEIGAQAALFPDKEYINGIAVAVYLQWAATPDLIHSAEEFAEGRRWQKAVKAL